MIYFRKIAFLLIFATILIVNSLRFFDLENIPKGIYLDDIANAVTAHSIANNGTDLTGEKWPLFASTGFQSPKPPTLTYPLALWTKIFGISISSIRIFGVLAYTLGLAGMFFLARLLGGSTCAWITLLAASISPWGWVYSRNALEPILASMFLNWGIFLFLRSSHWFNMAFAGFLMACAMYSYPTYRLFAPLIILLLIGYQMRQNKLSLRSLLPFLGSLTLISAPIVSGTLHGPLLQRYNIISIFSDKSTWQDSAWIFIKNYFTHLSPGFLFLTGDHNLRQSIGHFGELSWLDMLGLSTGLFLYIISFKKKKIPSDLVILMVTAAAIGIFPSALTNEGLPHAIRSIGSQLFIELLVGYSLAKAIDRWPQFLLAISLTGVFFAVSLITVYFTLYPSESAVAWNANDRISAEQCRTEKDWIKFSLYHSEIIDRYFILRNYPKPIPVWFLTNHTKNQDCEIIYQLTTK